MFSFLNIDGPFYKTLAKISNYMILGVMWVISCAPIITIAPACAAVYAAHHKVIQNGNGYIWKTYWQQFRSNFKQSFLLGLIMLVILTIAGGDIYILYRMGAEQKPAFLTVILVISAICVMWMQYWLPYIVHIEDRIGTVLKNTLIMTFAHLPQSILILAVFALCVAINLFVPTLALTITLILSPIIYSLCTYKSFVRVFTNYWDMTDGNAELEEKQLEEEKV
ncbi:MAG: YesL family protein [Oscillospiraceae bacterium]|nr:YesL family protein [Oscillospiraceae bacterium]MBQ8769517.1 YesL family protein [Oscillospiraceae bacterium]